MAELTDQLSALQGQVPVGVVKTLRNLTVRDENGVQIGSTSLPAGSIKLVYVRSIDYPWQFGDNRKIISPAGSVPLLNIWGGDLNTITMEYL